MPQADMRVVYGYLITESGRWWEIGTMHGAGPVDIAVVMDRWFVRARPVIRDQATVDLQVDMIQNWQQATAPSLYVN